MDERAALQRVELLERSGSWRGASLWMRVEHELVGAGRVMSGARSARTSAPRGACVGERCLRERIGIDQTVGVGPSLDVPAPRAKAQRPREVHVGVEQVARHADGLGLGALEDRLQEREIVLGLVDGVTRPRGAGQPMRAPPRFGAPRELVEPGKLALGGAQHLEPVERRRARTRLLDVEARIGEDETPFRGADRDAQHEPLGADRSAFVRNAAAELHPLAIGQDRILGDLLRKEAFGERRARTRRRTRGRAPLRSTPRTRGRRGARAGARPDSVRRRSSTSRTSRQIDRPHVGHGSELGQDREHALGVPQRAGRERRDVFSSHSPHGAENGGASDFETRQQRKRVRARRSSAVELAPKRCRGLIVASLEHLR